MGFFRLRRRYHLLSTRFSEALLFTRKPAFSKEQPPINDGSPTLTEVLSDDGHDVWTVRRLAQGPKRDVMSIPRWRRNTTAWLGFTAALPIVLNLWQFALQFRTILARTTSTDPNSHDSKARLGLLFLVFDVILFGITHLPQAIVRIFASRGRHRDRLRLVGDHVPKVDVVVTCCNEGEDIIQDTILAALAIDYPQDKFRVLLSDDGSSDALRHWVTTLGRPNLHYTSRVDRHGFKAGNLNHAADVVERLPGGASELLAVLDADMIAEKEWLRSVIAHIVLDKQVALACPSQHFYNVPQNDPLNQANQVGWHGHDVIRDLAGSAWNTGSGFVLRRKALQHIGGFPTHCLLEDVRTSLEMQVKGWKTVYVPEALQFGLVPSSYVGHLKQFTRWNTGACQFSLEFGLYLNKKRTGLLDFRQRLVGFASGVAAVYLPFAVCLGMALMPLRLGMGVPLVHFKDSEDMWKVLRIQTAGTLVIWLHQLNWSALAGYHPVIQEASMAVWMAPYYMFEFIHSFLLPSWLGGFAPRFSSTGSIGDLLCERTPDRAPLLRRVKFILLRRGAWFHLFMAIALSSTATFRLRTIMQALGSSGAEYRELFAQLIRGLGLPTSTWALILTSCLTPIRYILSPPTVPRRDTMLSPGGRDKVRYPLFDRIKPSRQGHRFGFVEVNATVIAFNAVVFLLSLW